MSKEAVRELQNQILLLKNKIIEIKKGSPEFPLGFEYCFLHMADGPQKELAKDILSAFFAQVTPRKAEVLSYLCRGMTNQEIGDHMCVTEKAVKFHLTEIYARLKVKNRTEAIVLILDSVSTLQKPHSLIKT